MRLRNLLLFTIVLFCISCRNASQQAIDQVRMAKFDKDKWLVKNGRDYPYRDSMLTDLMANYKLHDIQQEKLVEMLGSPDKTNNGHLYYTVAQKRLGGWPIHTKTLVFKFGSDSTVEWVKIHQ